MKCPDTKVKGWCDGGCASGIKYPSDEDGAVINRASSFFAAWVSKDFSDDEGFKENDDKLGMFTLLLFKHLCVTETVKHFFNFTKIKIHPPFSYLIQFGKET